MGRVLIVESSKSWDAEFRVIAEELGRTLGTFATRIDHIGSTSVPGLPSKDVIDIQVTVADLSTIGLACAELASLGYRVDPRGRDHPVPGEDPDEAAWLKGFAAEPPGHRRTNIHLRIQGAPNQEYPLLFRDYLRAHPQTAAAYAAFKQRAALLLPEDSDTYTDLKDPVCDLIYYPAIVWAESTGWSSENHAGMARTDLGGDTAC